MTERRSEAGTSIEATATLSLNEIAEIAGTTAPASVDGLFLVRGAAALETAKRDQIAYMDNGKYVKALAATRAGVCLVSARFAQAVPSGTIPLVCQQPYLSFARVVTKLYPEASRPFSIFEEDGISPQSIIHPTALLNEGVTADPGAIVGRGAEVGVGTFIGANAVIGPNVRIGRDCSIATNVSLIHAILGDRVILHPGVRIGQDGFGYAIGPQGPLKMPQLGRVIIGDDVEVGANSTIDRGSHRDTTIGAGTKIDNLVQIGHNVEIGRCCFIVAQVGIAGSTRIGNFVSIGGQAGLAGHITVGDGAQIGAHSGVHGNIATGAKFAGYPAIDSKDWIREVAALRRLTRHKTD